MQILHFKYCRRLRLCVCLLSVCLWLSAVFLRFILGLRYFTQGTLVTFSRGTFLWRFQYESFIIGRCGVRVCPFVCLFALGIYFWEHLELRNLANVSLGTLPGGFFQKNFKNLKMGFLANFFTFFLKNGAVFLWTHVQSWNCGEIMRGCLMKCIFFGRFSKISKLDFWRFFLWKSRESLVSNEITTRFLNQSELQWRLSLKNVVSSMKINIFNNSNTNDTTSSLQFRRLLLFQK